MKSRRIYYRFKNGNVIIEGKSGSKPVYFKALPSNPMELLELLHKASYISEGDLAKFLEKHESLSKKAKRKTKSS